MDEADEVVREIEEPTDFGASATRAEEAEDEDAETRKKKRKIYKGTVATAIELSKALSEAGVPVPVQPIVRKIPGTGRGQVLPPTFILTRFAPGWHPKNVVAHYYHPASGQVSFREVPEAFEFNILQGTRGAELNEEWGKAKTERLHLIAPRLSCTIGADPEVFVEKKGEVFPAWEFLGSKDQPDRYKGSYAGEVYWDGFQGEFNTPAGLSCLMQMSDAVHLGLNKVYRKAMDHKAKLSIKSVYDVNPDLLQRLEEKYVEFGCAPSFNVYGLKGNIESGRNVPFRFAGGHIHFGLDAEQKKKIQAYVKALDSVLAVACVSLFANFDNPIRRKFYGLPGEYRTPAHGMEYRVLSNAWLIHPVLFHMVFDLSRAVCGLVNAGFAGTWEATQPEVIDVVTNHDVAGARAILKRNEGLFKGVIRMCGGAYINHAETAAKIWNEGLETAVKDPEDIVGNWYLDGGWNHNNAMFTTYVGALSRGKKV